MTLEEFHIKIGQLFHVMDGPPRSALELPWPRPPYHTERWRYETFAIQASADTFCFDDLVDCFATMLVDLRAASFPSTVDEDCERPVLVWRTRPYDASADTPGGVKLWARLVIPGAPLMGLDTPEGFEAHKIVRGGEMEAL